MKLEKRSNRGENATLALQSVRKADDNFTSWADLARLANQLHSLIKGAKAFRRVDDAEDELELLDIAEALTHDLRDALADLQPEQHSLNLQGLH